MEAKQTLHDVWLSPGLVDYLYIFGGCCRLTELILPGAKFTVRPSSLALLYIDNVTARHSSSWRKPNFAALTTRHHLYSAG